MPSMPGLLPPSPEACSGACCPARSMTAHASPGTSARRRPTQVRRTAPRTRSAGVAHHATSPCGRPRAPRMSTSRTACTTASMCLAFGKTTPPRCWCGRYSLFWERTPCEHAAHPGPESIHCEIGICVTVQASCAKRLPSIAILTGSIFSNLPRLPSHKGLRSLIKMSNAPQGSGSGTQETGKRNRSDG